MIELLNPSLKFWNILIKLYFIHDQKFVLDRLIFIQVFQVEIPLVKKVLAMIFLTKVSLINIAPFKLVTQSSLALVA